MSNSSTRKHILAEALLANLILGYTFATLLIRCSRSGDTITWSSFSISLFAVVLVRFGRLLRAAIPLPERRLSARAIQITLLSAPVGLLAIPGGIGPFALLGVAFFHGLSLANSNIFLRSKFTSGLDDAETAAHEFSIASFIGWGAGLLLSGIATLSNELSQFLALLIFGIASLPALVPSVNGIPSNQSLPALKASPKYPDYGRKLWPLILMGILSGANATFFNGSIIRVFRSNLALSEFASSIAIGSFLLGNAIWMLPRFMRSVVGLSKDKSTIQNWMACEILYFVGTFANTLSRHAALSIALVFVIGILSVNNNRALLDNVKMRAGARPHSRIHALLEASATLGGFGVVILSMI